MEHVYQLMFQDLLFPKPSDRMHVWYDAARHHEVLIFIKTFADRRQMFVVREWACSYGWGPMWERWHRTMDGALNTVRHHFGLSLPEGVPA